MLSTAVRHLFGRFGPQPSHQAAVALIEARIETASSPTKSEPYRQIAWPAARLAMAHRLWGEGYVFPGGEIETLRLARPLGVSPATNLLVVGTGSGGPAIAIARNMGASVTGLESEPNLLACSAKLIAQAELGKKVSITTWNPQNPDFVPRSHHQCLALEPLLDSQPEPILDGLARVLKPGGQLVLTELAAGSAFNPADPDVTRWAALERRDPSEIPAAIAVARMLGRVGLDVRVAEDISTRHMEHAMLSWRILLRELTAKKTLPQQARQLVAEAELWLLRRQLIREGQLQMMRWHAARRLAPT